MLMLYPGSMTKRDLTQPDLFSELTKGIFGDYFATSKYPASSSSGNGLTYRCDASDTGMMISVDLPGVARSDASITIEGNRITVEYVQRGVTKKQHFTVRDDYDLPSTIAKLEHGVLELRIGRVSPTKLQKIVIDIK